MPHLVGTTFLLFLLCFKNSSTEEEDEQQKANPKHLKIMRRLVYLCVLSDLCLEGNICAISRLFVAGINGRSLLYSKKFKEI